MNTLKFRFPYNCGGSVYRNYVNASDIRPYEMSKNFAEISDTIFYLQRFTKRKIMTMTSAYRSISIVVSIMIVLIAPRSVLADAKIRSNVVYGMYSGLALLMDVHQPANRNGYGIIFIRGSSWRAPLDLDARPLKNKPNNQAATLLDGGYTLFLINHRAAPRFLYPAAVEDAQRATRYVRRHASRYGIDPDRIGAFGGSSGGYLVSMLGVLDGNGYPKDASKINRVSSKVQAVVALFPATDFVQFANSEGSARKSVQTFLGMPLGKNEDRQSQASLLYAKASPTTYISTDDPPFLLIHGDKDTVIPFSQSEYFLHKLASSGVIAELIRMPGGGHADLVSVGPGAPDYLGQMVDWFDRHLQVKPVQDASL